MVPLVCCCSLLPAQSNLATVNGVVTDPSQNTVLNAAVRARSIETGAVRTTLTGATGRFEIPGLTPGEYSVEAEAPGFATATRAVRLEVGQNMRLDLGLTIGPEKASVEVSSSVELLKTEDAAVGEVVEGKSVHELPLNGRMLLDLALTVPGSHQGHGAQTGSMNALYWRPGQASSLTVGGNRPNANYFLIDGATNTDPTFNTQNLSLSPDAVREFQVQTGSYSAEMGGAGGGQINIITKSGTSQYHGTGYEFLRNGSMDAHSFNEDPGGKFLVQNNFGASAGGPLAGKKTFFFANYEGLRSTRASGRSAALATSRWATKKSGFADWNTTTFTEGSASRPVMSAPKSTIVVGTNMLIGGLLKVTVHRPGQVRSMLNCEGSGMAHLLSSKELAQNGVRREQF